MAEKNVDQIKALYTEMSKVAPSQDWERILKIAKKILGFSVNEKKAFHCKIVCLIHLDKFDEALTNIERAQEGADLYFERAYCEYRLNKVESAYGTLMKCPEMSNKERELLAQVTYRLEKYQESYDYYRDLFKNIDDDFDAERQTNLSAVVASLRNSNPTSNKDLDMSENENRTYELCYNSACISLSKGNEQEAFNKLKKAEEMCIKTFEDDQEDQETLDNEIAIIKVQLAYCLQRQGKSDEALKIYNSVMKTKPSDLTVMAALNNNLVCLNKDQNIFDSKKRLKAATGSELDFKLNSLQLRTIAYNEILFSILTNQKDQVSKLLEQYKTRFGDKESYALLRTAQLHKEKKYLDAENFLRDTLKDSSNMSAQRLSLLKFYLIQTLLIQAKAKDAIEVFKSLDECKKFKLGIVSALVTLYKNKNENNAISTLFSEAIDYFTKTNPNAKELEIYIKENSNFQIGCNNLQKACEMLEKMRTFRPKDFRILSKLINTYSKFNPEKAKQLSKDLPSLEEVVSNANIDIETLETQFSLLNSKYGKVKTAGGSEGIKSPGSAKAKQQDGAIQSKKKKKRKIRLPKNYNPHIPVDAERWIPLMERSYYKGKRKKKNAVGKGSQGAGSTVSKDTPSTPQPQSPKAGAAIAPEADKAKPKAPAASQQKKNNKKKGGKW